MFHQSGAVHLRHHYVADHEVHIALMAGEHLESLGSRGGFEHAVAALAERAGGEAAHGILVLDQQNSAPPGEVLGRLAADRRPYWLGFSRDLNIARQVDAHDGALPEFALREDV